MATIKIKSKDDNFFIYELGVIKRDEPRNYHAKQTVCGDIRAEMVGDEQSDLFNPIHFSKIEVDGQTFDNANDCVTALNKVIYNDVASGGGTDAKLDVLNTTATAIKEKLEVTCEKNPINVNVCNQLDIEQIKKDLGDIKGFMEKISKVFEETEYEDDGDCGCPNKEENSEDNVIYCDPNKADLILSDGYYDYDDIWVSEYCLLVGTSKQISGGDFTIEVKATKSDGTVEVHSQNINPEGHIVCLEGSVTLENFKDYPKIEITTDDPRVNGKAVFKYGVRQDCVERVDTTVRAEDKADVVVWGDYDSMRYGISLSKEIKGEPVEVTVTVDGVSKTGTLPVNGELVGLGFDFYSMWGETKDVIITSNDPRLNQSRYEFNNFYFEPPTNII